MEHQLPVRARELLDQRKRRIRDQHPFNHDPPTFTLTCLASGPARHPLPSRERGGSPLCRREFLIPSPLRGRGWLGRANLCRAG